MRFTGGIFAVAAAVSLLLHALLFVGLGVIRVDTPRLGEIEVGQMPVVYGPIETVSPPDEPPPREFDLGEPGASGYASHPLDATREAVARQANVDQAELSLDPRGRDLVVEKPNDPAQPAPPGGGIVFPLVQKLQIRLQPWTLQDVAQQARTPEPVAPPDEAEQVPAAPDVPPPPEPLPVQTETAAPPAVQHRVDSTPGASPTPPVAADPAPQGDSESDAFSTLGTAEFRDGRFTVRSGRKVKTRRPKIGLAGAVDVMQRRPVRVVLKVEVDEAGKVTKVDVLRSSGTNEIDQPCRVAMYEWWFEPRTDASGRPVPDAFQFAIGFP